MNWKEQFDTKFRGGNVGTKGSITMLAVKHFISTEIIEKLIEDAYMDFLLAKQQNMDFTIPLRYLRDKWL